MRYLLTEVTGFVGVTRLSKLVRCDDAAINCSANSWRLFSSVVQKDSVNV